jgi:cytochrome oxidase Cu insertion factor (SCO1/SenC/PrrC family)
MRARFAAVAFAAALALGAGQPRFEAPAPGSYELPPIQQVREHVVLDEAGREAPLLALGAGEAALVSFVFLSCAGACPAATAVLARVDAALAQRPALAGRVQLVTMSFDPARDPPARMAALRDSLAPRGRWRFATAVSDAAIAPVLADFGQDPGAAHVLKIFLVDGERRVRNIYSTGFLDERLLLADLETVLGDAVNGPPAAPPAPRASAASPP